jgi:hypothetical protein
VPLEKESARVLRSTTSRSLLWWLSTRVLTLLLLVAFEGNAGVFGDVNYFDRAFSQVGSTGFADCLPEYPLAMVAVSFALWLPTATLGGSAGYALFVIIVGLAIDGLFTRALIALSVDDEAGVWAWILAVPLLGGLAIIRFDLIVGVLVATAVLTTLRRPNLATSLVAVAAALKLWPALLLPGFVPPSNRIRAGAVILAVGMVTMVSTVTLAGWPRLLSPMFYQTDRGLQIESVPATPLMLAWAGSQHPWSINFASSRAFEVSGPGSTTLALASSVLLLGLLLSWAWMSVRLLRRSDAVAITALVWYALAATTGLMVFSKVLSPQYLVWVLPVAAAGLVIAPTDSLRRWTWWLLVAAALTHVIYPMLYRGLVEPIAVTAAAVVVLALRNLLLVCLFCIAVRNSWTGTRRIQ